MKGILLNYMGLSVTGPDAKDFLQRITTVDFRKLNIGFATRGALLTATAKVLASFTVLRITQDEYQFFSSGPEIQSLKENLDKLHFSERLELGDIPGYAYAVREAAGEITEVFFPFSTGAFLQWPNTVWSKDPLVLEADDPDFWELKRIENKNPRLDFEWKLGESNALDVGFLPWIHEDKGCYPGQEVVERSLRVGHPARALILIEASDIAAGDTLLTPEGNLTGRVTSSLSQKALGIVQWKYKEIGTKFFVERNSTRLGEARCLK